MPSLRRVEVDGVGLSLRAWPGAVTDRPTVVLLSATGETARDWDDIAPRLSRHRRVYGVDLRGHGRSDWPGRYSVELMTADVVGVLDQLGAGAVDLVGHSLGGLVAACVAAASPSAVRRLVLEDVPLPHPRPSATPQRPPGVLDFDWRVVEQVRPEIDRPDVEHWRALIGRIGARTLVIGGGACSPMPQAHVAELVDRLADGRLETIQAGHFVHATKPDEFVALVEGFLSGA